MTHVVIHCTLQFSPQGHCKHSQKIIKNVFIGSKGENKRPRADIAITGLFGGVGTAGVFGCMASSCCHKVSHNHAIADFRRASDSLLAALQSPVPPGSSGAMTCLGI